MLYCSRHTASITIESKKQTFTVVSEIVKHGAIPDAFYLTSSLSALNHNHILSSATTASAISEAAACKLLLACDKEEHGSCAQAAHMWGISPVMGLTPRKPGAGSEQHGARTWRWLEIGFTSKTQWHNGDVSKTTVQLLKRSPRTAYGDMFPRCSSNNVLFFYKHSHGVKILNSIGCSLGRSSARGPFSLQAGTWRPRASTAWRWGLPFIWRLRANCYSIAPIRQRCILCSLLAVAAFARNMRGTNLFLLWQQEV